MRERAALALALILAASPASAHKLKVFATAVGDEISGYGYFVPGGRAQDADVAVTTGEGVVVAHLRTDANGAFVYRKTGAVELTFTLDAGDGHVASYRVGAEDGAVPEPANVAADAAASAQEGAPASAAQLQSAIEVALARQLRPLREEIDGWREQIWLHDVLGGLGYIIGLGGLAYGLTEGRRSRQTKDAAPALQEARR